MAEQNQNNQLTIYAKYNPSLTGGIYNINIAAGIKGLDTKGYFDDPYVRTFEVRGAQFAIPAGDVHSVYPPPNSSGIYSRVLPHIVLNKRVLPWERSLVTGNNSIPWLCLLILNAAELELPAGKRNLLDTMSVTEFLAPETGVQKPAIETRTVAADVLASQCQTIKLKSGTFLALVPRLDELAYLAHVREVDAENQVVEDNDDLGWFSVVSGNRLLLAGDKGQNYQIYLVSLEGFSAFLKPGAAITQPEIRLCSLYNWSLVSQPQVGESFTELVSHFVSQAGGNPENLLLRRYVDAPDSPDQATRQVMERLSMGYMAVGHKTLQGEETFAWYRGPFTPVIAQPLPRPTADYHVPSPDAAMIYDKTNGVFDQSYAAAWTIGRSLALADGTFGPKLLEFRRRSYFIVGKLMDYLSEQGEASQADLKQIINQNVVENAFNDLLVKDIGQNLTATFRELVPVPDVHVKTIERPEAEDPVAVARSYLASEAIQALLQDELEDQLIPIAHWLAELQLLAKVPFEHLVPDPAMLPVESLRFFYVDRNWLDVLVDGALSLGVHSSKDTFFNQAMKGVINDALNLEIKAIRSQVLGLDTAALPADTTRQPVSGLLIRSTLISGWPGLVVKGFKQDRELQILRMDRPAPGVLLCLFLDIPEKLYLSEPDQGLYFGLEDGNRIGLRSLSGEIGEPLKINFPAVGDFSQFYRSGGAAPGVLRINEGDGSLIGALEKVPQLKPQIQPPDFAIQMVKAPERLSFKAPAAKS